MKDPITDKNEMVALVRRILDMRYAAEESPGLLDLLARSTGHPEFSNLIFYPKRPMSAAEIIDTALSHRPIILGDRT